MPVAREEAVDSGLEVLRIIGLFLLGVFSLLGLVATVVAFVDTGITVTKHLLRARRRRRVHRRLANLVSAPRPTRATESRVPSYAHVLIVDAAGASEAAGAVEAVVEVATEPKLPDGRLRLELFDRDVLRLTTERQLDSRSDVTSVRIEVSPPVGVTIGDLLGWRWDVVLLDASGERARWREHLSPAGTVDAEAELVLVEHDSQARGGPGRASAPTTLYVGQVEHRALRALRDEGASTPWWETTYGRWRLASELGAMRERFPGFDACLAPDGHLGWVGRLRSGFRPANRYLVRVTYPLGFPDEAPFVRIEEPALPEGTPHVLGQRKLCLYRPGEGPRHGYDPARTTAATLVAWTAHWIHCLEHWQESGDWPAEEI